MGPYIESEKLPLARQMHLQHLLDGDLSKLAKSLSKFVDGDRERDTNHILEMAVQQKKLNHIPVIVESGVSKEGFNRALFEAYIIYVAKKNSRPLVALLEAESPGKPFQTTSPALRWLAKSGFEKTAQAIADTQMGLTSDGHPLSNMKFAGGLALVATAVVTLAAPALPKNRQALLAGGGAIAVAGAIAGSKALRGAFVVGRVKRLENNRPA